MNSKHLVHIRICRVQCYN